MNATGTLEAVDMTGIAMTGTVTIDMIATAMTVIAIAMGMEGTATTTDEELRSVVLDVVTLGAPHVAFTVLHLREKIMNKRLLRRQHRRILMEILVLGKC